MHVAGLFIYPVKSLRGLAVSAASLDRFGLIGDRRFLVIDAQNRFLTQRVLPAMATIETALTATALILRAPHGGSCAVPLQDNNAPLVRTTIWRDTVDAEDCGTEVAVWLSHVLRQPCRLVRLGTAYHRSVKPSRAQPGDVVTFADAFPLLAVSEASLAHLNDRLIARGESPVPMNRFRPSLVLAGCDAHAEDRAAHWRIGDVALRAGGPCDRCPITTTDQLTGERHHHEPLRTLATYRRDPAEPTNVNFGQNLVHETKSGTLHVGDAVTFGA
ncbi:MOSC domain-containing protein [Horticoccus luteus]|uniref:MOSC domain-containing protein n=1 Tax=Horticoccus luteus TaxID=2862869 RepID=A0A8F9TT80_9BACT|nr:MOSC N-terminal beta barrel domain-containing protein [Horticoccus luteus]QYM77863.1 MOSC domain-containing protein [Horticoccus luteus]